jgi:hypothetical protein
MIREAHYFENRGFWWWKSLPCGILDKQIWVNIATGRRITKWEEKRVATFVTWTDYVMFREALRDELDMYLGP